MKATLLAFAILGLSPLFDLQAAELPKAAAPPPSLAQQAQASKINLNQADSKTLLHSLKGIGKKRAEAIVAFRTKHGLFKSLEALAEVPGLGQAFVERNLAELQKQFIL